MDGRRLRIGRRTEYHHKPMDWYRRLAGCCGSVLLAITLLLAAFGQTVCVAAKSKSTTLTLNIKCTYEKEPVIGEKVRLYKVADITDDNQLKVVDAFASYSVDMTELSEAVSNITPINKVETGEDDESANLAETLATYAERDKIKSNESGTTDTNGVVAFDEDEDNIEKAVYLVVPEPLVEDNTRYMADAFLLALPGYNEGTLNYDVEAYPKLVSEEIPITTVMQAVKIWKDTGYTSLRPDKIEAQLLRNGEVYDTQTLNADNNWRYTWYDLDGQYVWKVLEKSVPNGYTLALETVGVRATITNTISPESYNPSDPSGSTETPIEPEEPTTSTETPDATSSTEPTSGTATTETDTSTTGDGTTAKKTSTGSTSSNGTTRYSGSTTTKPSQLPQTGQVWWPVPILGIVGLLCIILGVSRRDKK